MDPTLKEEAARRFDEALATSDSRDPREFYRDRLRQLKGANPEAYQQAVRYYSEVLIPGIAGGEDEPVGAWLEYGKRIATLAAPGRAMVIDVSGRAQSYEPPVPQNHLVLHLPDAQGIRAMVVGIPKELSPAQRATYDLLVQGKHKLPEA